jgi:probable O-glycosylation ligase (exosortase A-associated)
MLVVGLSLAFYGIKGAIFAVRTGGVHKVMGPEGVFIGENTFLGLALVMVIPVLISSAREEKGKVFKNFLYFAAGCCVVSAVFTYSRGALVGLAIILPLLFLKNPRKAWASIAFLLAAGSVVYAVAPEQLWKRAQTIETYETDLSAMQRLRAWSVSLNIAKDRPFTGAGFQFEYADNREQWLSYVDERYRNIPGGRSAAHSAYFQVMGQHGFVAFSLYVLLLACTLATLARIRKQARESSEAAWLATYADGLLIGTIAFGVSGAFLNVAYFDLYFIYVAMTAILGREHRGFQTSITATAPRAIPVTP